MSGTNLVLAFDVVNQALVSFQGSAAALPAFRQSSYLAAIYLVQPVAGALPGSTTYQTINYASYDSIRMGIWSNSTGTASDSEGFLLALTDSIGWSLQTDSGGYQYFSGTFNVNTEEIAEFLGSKATSQAWFAVNLVKGIELYSVFDQTAGSPNCTVLSATDEFSGSAVSVTGAAPVLILPLQIINPVTGNIFAFQETTPGTLQLIWVNHP